MLQKNCRGDADVEAFGEAAHRYANAAFASLGQLGMNAVPFVAEDETNLRKVPQIFRKEFAQGVRRDKLVTAGRERIEGAFAVGVRAYVDPLFRAAGDLSGSQKLDAGAFDDMQAMDAKGIARAQDGSTVVWIVGGVHENGDGIEALRKDGLEPGAAFVGQKGIELAHDDCVVEFSEAGEESTLDLFDEHRVWGAATHGTGAGVAREAAAGPPISSRRTGGR